MVIAFMMIIILLLFVASHIFAKPLEDFRNYFEIDSTFLIEGETKEEAITNVRRVSTDKLILEIQNSLRSCVKYDKQNIKAEKLRDNVYEISATWKGHIDIHALNELQAESIASELLDEYMDSFETVLKEEVRKGNIHGFLSVDRNPF